MGRIAIANPRPGSARYTTRGQAERYVRLGRAVIDGMVLHWLADAERRQARNVERRVESRRLPSDVYVGGSFEIAVVNRWTYPHTQWLHGEREE
jgi:hypothetical protein